MGSPIKGRFLLRVLVMTFNGEESMLTYFTYHANSAEIEVLFNRNNGNVVFHWRDQQRAAV